MNNTYEGLCTLVEGLVTLKSLLKSVDELSMSAGDINKTLFDTLGSKESGDALNALSVLPETIGTSLDYLAEKLESHDDA